MNKLLSFVLISQVCVGSFLYGSDIPKKANTISISGQLSQVDYFKTITDLLFVNGYGILNSDKETGIITTTEKSIKQGSIRLTLLVKDNKVIIRGQFSVPGITEDSQWESIQYQGQAKSAYMNAWNEMARIAEAIPGSKSYIIN